MKEINRKVKVYQIMLIMIGILATACGTANTAESPAASLEKFIEASKTKDIQTTKNLLSKNSIDEIEKFAVAQNKTVDEILLNDSETALKESPETRNEKIEGSEATIEVKNKLTGEFETIPFVKEEGIWKIALDKFVRNAIENRPQTPDAPTSASNNQSNKPAENNNQ